MADKIICEYCNELKPCTEYSYDDYICDECFEDAKENDTSHGENNA